MSDIFKEAVERSIYREMGGKIFETLAASPEIRMGEQVRVLKVPLVAEASVLYDVFEPRLTFRASGWTSNGDERLGFQQIFSTEEVHSHHLPALMQHVIEKAAHMAASELMKRFPRK